MRPQLGIFGGCFDPPHNGHLGLANRMRNSLGLSRVIFMLAARPPHKPVDRLTPLEHRQAMLDRALQEIEGLEPGNLEAERGGTGYTIDTMRAAREAYPDEQPIFLAGFDSLLDLPGWRDWKSLVEEFDIVIAERQGIPATLDELPKDLRERVHRIDTCPEDLGRGGRVFLLPISPAEVSSREVRSRSRRGQEIDELVPPAVARYISSQMLYSQESSSTDSLPADLVECIAAARDRQAEKLVVLDLRGISDVTDYFVICHASSSRQVKAIAETIEDRLRTNLSIRPKHVEGRTQAEWILMDYIDIVVHVFLEEKRSFYRIESLWGDAPIVELPLDPLASDSSFTEGA